MIIFKATIASTKSQERNKISAWAHLQGLVGGNRPVDC